jgi:tRNA-dihydrouridine synthase
MIAADQSEVGKGFVQWLFSQAPASCRPHRIDINMGCPSKRTTSRGQQLAGGRTSRGGAGSSLLIDPSLVSNVTAAVRAGLPSTACCLSVKMRVGYDDEALFTENMLAAAEHADYLQIHARSVGRFPSSHASFASGPPFLLYSTQLYMHSVVCVGLREMH